MDASVDRIDTSQGVQAHKYTFKCIYIYILNTHATHTHLELHVVRAEAAVVQVGGRAGGDHLRVVVVRAQVIGG